MSIYLFYNCAVRVLNWLLCQCVILKPLQPLIQVKPWESCLYMHSKFLLVLA